MALVQAGDVAGGVVTVITSTIRATDHASGKQYKSRRRWRARQCDCTHAVNMTRLIVAILLQVSHSTEWCQWLYDDGDIGEQPLSFCRRHGVKVSGSLWASLEMWEYYPETAKVESMRVAALLSGEAHALLSSYTHDDADAWSESAWDEDEEYFTRWYEQQSRCRRITGGCAAVQ